MWPFRKKTETKWRSLSRGEQAFIARKVSSLALQMTAKHFGRGYEAVSAPFSSLRRRAKVEHAGEDGELTPRQRNELISLERDMMRNSPTRVAQDQQLRVNAVGSVGGKLYASFPEGFGEAAEQVMHYFNRVWAPKAEYTFQKSFNWLLKTALTSMDVNGNVILVFDDGVLSGGNGSGRIRGFEGDEIACVSETDFLRLFGSKFSQSQGFVYDRTGVFSGAFVSTVERGENVFSRGKYITLRRTPGEDTNWIALGDMRRFNQGRAVSPLTAALTCLVDLHETVGSEAAAAKLNAQLVGQILRDANSNDSTGADVFDLSGGENETIEFNTRQLDSIGARFDEMPEGLKIELLDTKRPNQNIPAYIDFLTGLVGGTRGLARVYSTLKAQTSYTAFRGEQVMSWPSFEEAQKTLERDVCDWAARQVIERGVKAGAITAALPENWQYMIAWRWPKMREVSERDAQAAIQLKLQNGLTSLTRELSPGEVEKITLERAKEKELFDKAGLIYPGTVTVSGAIVPNDDNKTDDGENDE